MDLPSALRYYSPMRSRCEGVLRGGLRGAGALGLGFAAVLAFGVPSGVAAQARRAPESAQLDEEARHLFEAGTRAFNDGRFETALARFREAYELSGRPALLYNIGQAADRVRLDREALDAFERYLAAEPEAANRREVESRITALRRVVNGAGNAAAPATAAPSNTAASTTATPATTAATTSASSVPAASATPANATPRDRAAAPADPSNTPVPSASANDLTAESPADVRVMPAGGAPDADAGEPSGSMLGALGWTSIGVGAAGLGVSVAALLLRNGEATAFNGPECLVAGRTRAEVCGDRYDAGKQWEAVAIGTLAAGGALVATGAVLLLLGGDSDSDADSHEPDPARASATCAPQLGDRWGLACAGTF